MKSAIITLHGHALKMEEFSTNTNESGTGTYFNFRVCLSHYSKVRNKACITQFAMQVCSNKLSLSSSDVVECEVMVLYQQ